MSFLTKINLKFHGDRAEKNNFLWKFADILSMVCYNEENEGGDE